MRCCNKLRLKRRESSTFFVARHKALQSDKISGGVWVGEMSADSFRIVLMKQVLLKLLIYGDTSTGCCRRS